MHKVVEVLGGVGKTGMGIVYVCERYGGDGLFVLKTFQDRFLRNARVREAFQREAVMNVRLGWHPHTVTANTALILDGRPFIDMLYVPPDAEGRRTLDDYLAATSPGRPLPLAKACRFGVEICHGMEHAAALGITPHQDLKPGNVLISEGMFAKVGDFGLARAVDADLSAWHEETTSHTAVGSVTSLPTKRGIRVVGTPPWMSPEHFDGRTDERSDIYALGIMLFQMACGCFPYRSGDWEYAHRTEAVPRFNSPLAAIVYRALAKSPNDRYQAFAELRHDLEVVHQSVTGETCPNLTQVLQAMGSEQNCLGGWGKKGAIDHLVNLATTLHNFGHDDEAEPLLRQALAINSSSPLVHATLGLVLRRRGAFEESLTHLKRAAENNPTDPLILHNTATTLVLGGRYKEALPLLDKAITLDENLPGILADKAFCLERLGAYDQAMSVIEKVLARMPRDPQAWLLKAQILIGMKNGLRAMEALAQGLRFVTTHELAQAFRALEAEALRVSAPDTPSPRQAQGIKVEFPFTIPLPRDRVQYLRSLLRSPRRPSKRITSAQLAAAVRGDADTPAWAQDRQFEEELESLLQSEVVWVCPDCDGIIAFFECAREVDRPEFLRDLTLIHSRDGVKCPECHTESFFYVFSESLRHGQAVTKQAAKRWAKIGPGANS
jgi:tetratricopeptide (TPR) repeat protein